MVLIIPSIPIAHGLCSAQIATSANETHSADREIYSQDPVERARLLRKENSKMLHLIFVDHDPWEPDCLEMIREMRGAVDIPFGLSISELPTHLEDLKLLFEAGVYRVFLPIGTPEDLYFSYCDTYTIRKIVPTVDLSFDFEKQFPIYREHKVERIAVEISSRDTLEFGAMHWERLQEISRLAFENRIKLTALHGVRGYPELSRFQDIIGGFDSLVLCRALNENRFPCQLIWREVEAAAALEATPAHNLWSNPLGDRPHV